MTTRNELIESIYAERDAERVRAEFAEAELRKALAERDALHDERDRIAQAARLARLALELIDFMLNTPPSIKDMGAYLDLGKRTKTALDGVKDIIDV